MHQESNLYRRRGVPASCRFCFVIICLFFGNCVLADEPLAKRLPAGTKPFPQFTERIIDSQIGKVCYAVTLADINEDGQQDIVAVSENRVLWYENPSWQSHVMIEDQTPRDNVCIAPRDINGDGHIDFAVGAGWTKSGTLHWIERADSLEQPWKVHSIGKELWLHRARWSDVLGSGQSQLVISALNGSAENGARLLAFEVPTDPVNDRWMSTELNSEFNRMHNHWHLDLDQDQKMDTLTASQEGITLVQRIHEEWKATRLGHGASGDANTDQGAGEIKIGHLLDGTPFIVTVEPMHGHSLVLYQLPESGKFTDLWQRNVIDTGFQRGHALWTEDMDGDGSDEIVFGHSDTPDTFGVIVYDCSQNILTSWTKYVVDAGGMATEDLVVADLTGDGRPDIVAGGRATHNVKLYVNTR
ncbi:MAG: VCBS repeat-containing protein [Planctomycetaceae bacterium]|nr:VCBS repeat-containing protein [Planctomycetaceae bacterium]